MGVGVERRLLRSAYLLTGDLHRAEDLVQEALVKVAMRWDRLREGNPTAYARTILVRDQISWWRRRREVPVEEVTLAAGVSSDPDAAMVVRRALQRLTPAQRAVVTVVVSVHAVGGEPRSHELPPASHGPSESAREAPWDPRGVESLPAAAADVATLLPDELRVPGVAPHVEDDPVDAAVLAVDDGADVLLLGIDGRWRCVVVDGKTQPSPVLSPAGTRLAVADATGVVTVDLATGTQKHLPLPAGYRPARNVPGLGMQWLDEGRLLITDGDDAWVLDVDRGTNERATDRLVRAQASTLGRPALSDEAAGWDVRPVAELMDGSALLRVAPPRAGDNARWWIVQWNPVSGDLALVTSVAGDPDRPASFARDLVTFTSS